MLACQQKLKQNRAAKILALVPRSHALSESSDISDTEIEHELHERISSSSPSPSLDSSFERMHLLSSSSNDDDVETVQQELNNIFEDVPLTPLMEVVCPVNREPNYFDIPSISSIPSLPSATATPTARPPKTRSRTKIAPVAKRPKKMKKFTLDYKWTRAVFRHRATIQESELESEEYIDLPDTNSSLNHFYKFFSPDIITYIVEQTNIYSVQQTGKSMQLTDEAFRDFLAIHIIMGIVNMPSYVDYWSGNLRYGLVADLMSLKRYQQIRRFLHFADNTLEDGDRYYKVRPVVEKIKKNCLMFETDRKFSIDEMMIPYKGRKAGSRKQYMKDKPSKWGFKNYVRAGISGMIYDFILYGGEDTFRFHSFTDQEASVGFGAQIVIALCQSIKTKPATVFCDNFFTSPELFHLLRENHGIFALGTIRNNRIRGAEKVLPTEKVMKKKERGSYAQAVCNKNKLAIVRWNDNKPVTLISTYVAAEPVHKIKRYSKEKKVKVDVECPQIVKDYNKHMGGVDLADMLISLYRTPLKTRRWYLGIFAQLIDICVNNGWLLYKRQTRNKNNSLKTFRFEIYEGLVKDGRCNNLCKENECKIKKPRSARPTSPVRYDNVGHFISTKEDMGRCKYCNKNTTVYCIKCNIRLCFVTGKNPRNCFLSFHSRK